MNKTSTRESFVSRLDNQQGDKQHLIGMTTHGKMWIPFQLMARTPPFNDEKKRTAMLGLLKCHHRCEPSQRGH